jgi:hypothetical protein
VVLAAPSPIAPARGASVQALPAFGWRGVGGADHYEFELGADPSFNSPVLGHGSDSFSTNNTWATVGETIPNGTYWWHVRAVSKSGGVSGWSAPRIIRKHWTSVPKLLGPPNGHDVSFPTQPLVLSWSPVSYAAKYLVYLASDRDLGTLVGDRPIETAGVTYSPSVTLAIGTYYWAVTPVDAQGNRGIRSRIASFTWTWRSETAPIVRDLVAPPEHYDLQLTWKAVPGAARYEIEINPAKEWTTGSKVCCKDPVVTTTFSPTDLLPNNRYYFRVRAINVDGNAGRWTPQGDGTTAFSFTKVFDNYEGTGLTTIKNIRLLDNSGNTLPIGSATVSPILAWDPVPGASRYEFSITRQAPCPPGSRGGTYFDNGTTAVPAWTPLASPRQSPPYPAPAGTRIQRATPLCPGSYGLRIRAFTDRGIDGKPIYGNYTYVTNAFTLSGYPAGGGPFNESAYLAPVRGQVQGWTPLFRWQAIAGAGGYWVIVSKDRSFTTIVDYALTPIPAYAPRVTYEDEETLYYWAIIPTSQLDGTGPQALDPNFVPGADFHKRSAPPKVILPARDGSLVLGPPTFQWTPAMGAKYYRLQVSQDRNFGTLLDDVETHSTAYTSTRTYPSNAALYVRVRAVDDNEIGLTWSSLRRFRDALARPLLGTGNASVGDFIPTWVWRPIQGALSYDIHVDLPDGSKRDFSNELVSAFTATKMTGTGVFRWQVRAEFPEARGGKTAVGPYTRPMTFTRTIRPPTGARASVGGRSLLLSWRPKLGADHYLVQVATAPDFGNTLENDQTDSTSFAPDLRSGSWSQSTVFYWRVAAVDADGNSGNYTPVRSFRLHLPKNR